MIATLEKETQQQGINVAGQSFEFKVTAVARKRLAITSLYLEEDHFSVESYREMIDRITLNKIDKFERLIQQLAWKANTKKGHFVSKEIGDQEDFYQQYVEVIWRCVELYCDQPDSRLDVLIRSSITSKSIDFSNARKQTEVHYEDEDGAVHKSSTLCYQFSELSSDTEDSVEFDVSDETYSHFVETNQKKRCDEKNKMRDLDQCRKSIFSDSEYNQFLDFKSEYHNASGKMLLNKNEMSLLFFLTDPQGFETASSQEIASHLNMSYSKYNEARKNVTEAVRQFREMVG